METKKIRFVANRPWLTKESASKPGPILKTLPDWYRKADRHAKDPKTGLPWRTPEGGKFATWKACPAIFDVMGSGYAYKTPCDIEFGEDMQGNPVARLADSRYENFLTERMPLDRFPPPQGYHAKHFAWWPDWTVELPDGYSALYTQPLNRHELPFLTMSGIVDNDRVKLPGTMPFFVLRGTRGILPAGTPYAQIIPFRREHWLAEYDTSLLSEEIEQRNRNSATLYRTPEGGVYLKQVWEKRKYSG